MRTHLTQEEIEKYLDTTDDTEEYLLWMETISEHIEGCEICEKRIQKALITETMLGEDNLGNLLKLAQQEEDIRRNILICKLYRMAQDDNIKEEMKQNLMQIMESIQKQSVNACIIHAVAMQKRISVTRGKEKVLFNKGKEAEVLYDKNCLQIYDKNKSQKKFTAVLNHTEKNPQIAQALWVEEKECFVAEFEIEDNQTDFEIYIIP